MIEITYAAAMQLRAMLRSAGVVGVPAVRVRGADRHARGALFEIVIEDRAEAGDRVGEGRGIRFYLDDPTSSALGGSVLDVDGNEFVFRFGVAREELERRPAPR